MNALRYFWKNQRIPLLALAGLVVALVWFGSRFLLEFIYFNDPAHRNQSLEAWMTPRYVSLSYKVPPEIIFEVMEIGDPEGRHPHLDEITARMGITIEELEERVLAAQAEWEAELDSRRPDPPPEPRDKRSPEETTGD